MQHYWLFRFNSEILIWKVRFSKSETYVWHFSGYSTDINPVLHIYWILNALLRQNKIPWGPTWPVVSRSAPLNSAPVSPFTLLLAQQVPGPWLPFLFLQGVKLISICSLVVAGRLNISQVLPETSYYWAVTQSTGSTTSLPESRYQLYHLLTRCPWRTCPPVPLISSFVKWVKEWYLNSIGILKMSL